MSTKDIQTAYAKYADLVDRMEWFDRLLIGRYRRKQFENIDGRVLDVACGTGTNFRHLSETIELVGIDISPEMLAKARERRDQLNLDGELHRMDAQALEFPDDSFDAVISTLSTCTFPDPIAALQEMERVCKATGQILLVEHGRSSVELIARFQEWRADSHYNKMGCRSTQEPLEHVSKAGLPILKTESGMFGIITTVEAQPN
ncbi:class I SAM-dependent methyltransferase [Natrarchaeobius halalkaliphilus]|uniref:Class I SAM-dependent methyltransferase n=2 Tax=Natrarchaeobius halalkaliphilus TaxID=1679091 RepID=A0A3N6N526_9EURY|nr:class I SAM-dependent methyltransferase [Natrarchaeobius halalkaliphilus]